MILPALVLLAVLAPAAQDTPSAAPSTDPPAAADEATPAASRKSTAGASTSSGDPLQAGLTLYKKRRFRQAVAEFQRAVEADPQSAAAQYYLGYTIYKIAEPRRPNDPGKQQAAEHFAKAYELDPSFRPTWKG